MPFRSESEQQREQLRRIEEQASELLEEKAQLEEHAESKGRRGAWITGAVVAVVAASFVGYGIGAASASTDATRWRMRQHRDDAAELAREQAIHEECKAANAELTADIAACEAKLADKLAQGAEPIFTDPPCRCAEGAPTCDCPFNRRAAVEAFSALQAPIQQCIKPLRTVSFHTKITFEPKYGHTERVSIDGPGELSTTEKTCVDHALTGAKVPPFGGAPVSVGKTFSFVSPL